MQLKGKKVMSMAIMAGAVIAMGIVMHGCSKGNMYQAATAENAAEKVYIPHGQWDKYYAFLSGGFNGQVMVYGMPSMRKLKTIPVFSQFSEDGYGYDEETKAMLNTSHGFIPGGDSHHTELSQTNGVPDGRWLFINENNTPRIARIDLNTMETGQILELPFAEGNHASPFITENSEYITGDTRFSVPMPQQDVAIASYAKNFNGMLYFIKIDPKSGGMSIGWGDLVPPFDYDLSHCGKGPSKDWCFFTSYNTEQAHTLLEVNASKNDKDYIIAINWKKQEACAAQGKGSVWNTDYDENTYSDTTHTATTEVLHKVRVMTPADCPDSMYYIPAPKSPHGIDVSPGGNYFIAGSKLATVDPAYSFAKLEQAINNKDFEKTVDGIPVLKYDSVMNCEAQKLCLGPLHDEFDGKGNIYTSCFVSSEIVKWDYKTCQIEDRIPAYYSTGHLMIPGGDSAKPWGEYLLALNKIRKGLYLPTGPEQSQAGQLYDITGNKMKLLLDVPLADGEPHYAQAIPADLLVKNNVKIYPLNENKNKYATLKEEDAKVVRTGKRVDVYMTAIRSHFVPDNIEGIKVGDTVYFHVTNIEQDWDIPHGFAVYGANTSNLLIMPGQTRTLVWTPNTPGVFSFYCTDFCSALHQEMQGYVRVSPANSNTKLAWGTNKDLQ
ncbi:MAG: Sec-dependent nitrous-oxide reductase [Acidobacteriaceae bacterium]